MKPAIPERYLRSDDFAAHIDHVTFAPEVWGVFAKLDEPRNTAELAELLQFDLPLIEASLQLLLDHKLIRKHVLSWRDYAAASSPPPPPPHVLPPPPPPPPGLTAPPAPPPVVSVSIGKPVMPVARMAPPPPPPAAVAAPVPAVTKTALGTFPGPHGVPAAGPPFPPPPSTVVSCRLPAYRQPTPRVTAAVSLRLASPGKTVKGPPPSARAPRWRLSPVLKAIGAKAGGGLAGQLLIYRVFLHVPAGLMRECGLHSFGLQDDDLIVAHAPLRSAIAEAAKLHAGLDVSHLLAA